MTTTHDDSAPHGIASDVLPRSPAPPPTGAPADVEEIARLAPDHWIGSVDPGWHTGSPPPASAVAGRWRSGLDGTVEEWEGNDAYRPSPEALGWPEPTDPVDAALHLAVTGYGPLDAVVHALTEARLMVLTLPDGSPVAATAADGGPVVPAYTAPPHLDAAGVFAFVRLTVPDLLSRLPPDHRLYLNPTSPAGTVLDLDHETLTRALTAVAAPASPGPDPAPRRVGTVAESPHGFTARAAEPGRPEPAHGPAGH
ncbi:SseB family protein [Streptomyces sp. ISL-12]|uniref:type VII secretion system-associated protein n=1 Tax=Streptomyces sp. ISL-12 TaxID=2819177 RepID=UPI001BE9B841|nr:type VII secretion system-associated protein [Streptomyces sp. ISL-12]MBT2411931.1 SseB family protein [Streptomyces sp. ISL-12]